MTLIERHGESTHRRDGEFVRRVRVDVDDLDELEAKAAALEVVGQQLRGAVSTLTSVRVWAEVVRDRHSDEHVRRHMRMLLGLLDGEDPQ